MSINQWLLNHKELISVYSSLFQTVVAIAIPIVLAVWAGYSEMQKEKREQARIERDKQEQIKKDEKNVIISFIKENIYPLDDVFEKFSWDFGTELKKWQCELDNINEDSTKEIVVVKNIEITENNYKSVLATILQKCGRRSVNLMNLISSFQYYNYIVQYLDILLSINYKIQDNIDKISKSELICGILRTVSNIRASSYLIESDKEIYEMFIPKYFYDYCKGGSILKEITLEVLKDYPKYYDVVQNSIKEKEEDK